MKKMSSGAVAAIEQPSPNNNDLVEIENDEMTQTANNSSSTNNNTTTAPSSSCSASSTSIVVTTSGIGGVESPPTSTSSVPPSIEQHCRFLEEENQSLKDSQARLQQQVADAQRRERILMRRLANKEQEFQDYVSQIAEYKSAQAPGPVALRSALLDPAVNLLFEKLKHELQATRAKLEETQNELSAWKFTPDSNTGKRLMAKCRLLYQENEELGKMTSNGRLAKLEGELAMQKSFSEEVKKSQSELDDFLQELDEDVEGMQSTILFLQQELKATRDRIQSLERENSQLKNGLIDDSGKTTHLVNGKSTLQAIKECDEISESYESEERTVKISSNSYIIHNSCSTVNSSNILNEPNSVRTNNNSSNSIFYNGSELTTTVNGIDSAVKKEPNIKDSVVECVTSGGTSNNSNKSKVNLKKRNYDSDSSENSSTNGCTLRSNKKLRKKTRRSSVLSIDLNEEDTQIADESEEETNQRIMTRRKSARNHQVADN